MSRNTDAAIQQSSVIQQEVVNWFDSLALTATTAVKPNPTRIELIIERLPRNSRKSTISERRPQIGQLAARRWTLVLQDGHSVVAMIFYYPNWRVFSKIFRSLVKLKSLAVADDGLRMPNNKRSFNYSEP